MITNLNITFKPAGPDLNRHKAIIHFLLQVWVLESTCFIKGVLSNYMNMINSYSVLICSRVAEPFINEGWTLTKQNSQTNVHGEILSILRWNMWSRDVKWVLRFYIYCNWITGRFINYKYFATIFCRQINL